MTRRGRWRVLVTAVALVAVAGAGCGDGGDETVEATVTSTTTEPPTQPLVKSADLPGLGTVVVAQDGMTLYRTTRDTGTTITCTDECAAAWPPLLAAAGEGAAGDSPIGTLARPDGALQVTWRGVPLYRYAADQAPGDAKGQGVGGVWFVVPEAEAAQPAQATTTVAPAPGATSGATTATTRAPTATTRQPATTAATSATTAPAGAATTAPPATPAPTAAPTTAPPATSPPTTSPPSTPPTTAYCDYPPCNP